MAKEKRIVFNSNNAAAIEENKKNQLNKAEEKVVLATGSIPKAIQNKSLPSNLSVNKDISHAQDMVAMHSSMPAASSTNQIANTKHALKKSTKKRSLTATAGHQSKLVKFSDECEATLKKHKKATTKKKLNLHPRSNSVVVGSSSKSTKQKTGVGKLSALKTVKRKLKVKKNRSISNVMMPTMKYKPLPTPPVVQENVGERILTRVPLENALANALQMQISGETIQMSGGGYVDILGSDKLYTKTTTVLKNPVSAFVSLQVGDLPNVKKAAGDENQKKTPQRKPPVNNGGTNTPVGTTGNRANTTAGTTGGNGNRANTPKPNGSTSTSSSGSGEDPNKNKNKRDSANSNNNNNEQNSNDTTRPGPSNASTNSAKLKRKRKLTEENSAKVSNDNVAIAGPGSSAQSAEDENDKEEEDKDAKKKKNRCAECRKKVGLTGFQCRCGGLYCAVHRYSDKHNCTFNYREHGAQEIRRNNPVVVGEKIQKI